MENHLTINRFLFSIKRVAFYFVFFKSSWHRTPHILKSVINIDKIILLKLSVKGLDPPERLSSYGHQNKTREKREREQRARNVFPSMICSNFHVRFLRTREERIKIFVNIVIVIRRGKTQSMVCGAKYFGIFVAILN